MDITHLTPDAEGSIEWPSFSNDKKAVVTLGAFDGMHLGHQAVIKRVVELAHQHDAFSVVILFDPRPAFVHGWVISHHGEEPAVQNVDAEALTSVDDRLHRMEQFGVDHVLVVHYTLAFAAMSYIFFLGRLTGKLGMRTLVLGQDAAMGKGREGDVKHIANLAAATGVFELDVVDDRGMGRARRSAGQCHQSRAPRMEQEEPGQGNARMELHQCALPAGSWPNPGRQRHSGCSALHRGRSGAW